MNLTRMMRIIERRKEDEINTRTDYRSEQLIQKSKDMRNFNDNNLHAKVARILIDDEEKRQDSFDEIQRRRDEVKSKSRGGGGCQLGGIA